jgi:hypothetical protein
MDVWRLGIEVDEGGRFAACDQRSEEDNEVMQDPGRSTSGCFLEDLIEQHALVAGDVICIDAQTWAIHGTIPVDGDVLMAEYHHADDAMHELERLRPNLPAA